MRWWRRVVDQNEILVVSPFEGCHGDGTLGLVFLFVVVVVVVVVVSFCGCENQGRRERWGRGDDMFDVVSVKGKWFGGSQGRV